MIRVHKSCIVGHETFDLEKYIILKEFPTSNDAQQFLDKLLAEKDFPFGPVPPPIHNLEKTVKGIQAELTKELTEIFSRIEKMEREIAFIKRFRTG